MRSRNFSLRVEGGDESAGFRAVGVLADYAEVGQEYESAIEQFLRDELEYVVVETFDVARAGIAMLRDEVGGRATFFVDSLRKLNVQPNEPVGALRDRTGNRFAPRSSGGISRSAGPGGKAVSAAAAIGVPRGTIRSGRAARARESRVFLRDARRHDVPGPRRQRRPPVGSGPARHEARIALAGRGSAATRARGVGSAGGAASP